MTKPHYYAGLDSRLTVHVPMRKLADDLEDLNYGTHQLLSHLVDVRRERLQQRAETYRARGDYDVAESVLRRGDPLADGIEDLLNRGLY